MALSTGGRVSSVQRGSKNLQKETGKAPIPHDQGNPRVFRRAAYDGESCCRREPNTCRAVPGRHRAPVDTRRARAGRRRCLRLGLDRARWCGRGRHHRGRALPPLTAALTAAASRTPAGASAAPSATARAPAGAATTAATTAAAATRAGARAARGRRARARTATCRAATDAAGRGPAASATTGRAPAGALPVPAAPQGRAAGGAGPARVQDAAPQRADEQHVGRDAHAPAHGARGARRRHPSPPFALAEGDPCRNGSS